MGGFNSVQLADYVFQFLDVGHAVALILQLDH
jgi:hypothetical protein